jgi:hypothetical protein
MIGDSYKLLQVIGVNRISRYSKTGFDKDVYLSCTIAEMQGLMQFFPDPYGRLLTFHLRANYAKFIATISDQFVIIAHFGHEAIGYFNQYTIPYLVSIGIVDVFEIVYIEEQKGEITAIPVYSGNFFLESLVQGVFVAQPGKSVAIGCYEQLNVLGV